jgi:hypothetical protein
MTRMNVIVRVLVSASLGLALASGCGGDDDSDDDGGGSDVDGGGTGADSGNGDGADAGGDSECGEPVTCDDVSSAPGWSEGTAELLPADFPEAPAGATLCGESSDTNSVYWTVDDDSTVHEHYETELTAAGWTADGPPQDAMTLPCDTVQYLRMGDDSIQVYVYGGKRAFTIGFLTLQ